MVWSRPIEPEDRRRHGIPRQGQGPRRPGDGEGGPGDGRWRDVEVCRPALQGPRGPVVPGGDRSCARRDRPSPAGGDGGDPGTGEPDRSELRDVLGGSASAGCSCLGSASARCGRIGSSATRCGRHCAATSGCGGCPAATPGCRGATTSCGPGGPGGGHLRRAGRRPAPSAGSGGATASSLGRLSQEHGTAGPLAPGRRLGVLSSTCEGAVENVGGIGVRIEVDAGGRLAGG